MPMTAYVLLSFYEESFSLLDLFALVQIEVVALITIRYLVGNINPTKAVWAESVNLIFDQSLTIVWVVQYKEQGDSVSSVDEEASFLEKSAEKLLKKVSLKAPTLSG
ncbi:MAG TPA: hypothetical protein VNW73_13930 [Ktedonobacteraceae bacterium]|nr:hypothetical protein [Ktedonobacteraceae bacterium]